MSELLTVAQVAARLTVHRRTVGRLIESGRLRVVRPSPGRIAVPSTELDAYLAHLEKRGAA